MKALKQSLCFVLLLMVAGPAAASDRTAIAMEGSYLLIQDDGYQRVLSLDRSGIAYQVASEQSVIGFTSGQGAWDQTGGNTASVRLVDFAFTFGDGKRVGPAVVEYRLTFSEETSGRFQKLQGFFSGAQHAVGQNALTTKEQPLRTFRVSFTGQRITID